MYWTMTFQGLQGMPIFNTTGISNLQNSIYPQKGNISHITYPTKYEAFVCLYL